MPDTPPSETDPPDPSSWDAVQVMRDRATEARRERERAISNLRTSMDDDQILDEFGINLGELER